MLGRTADETGKLAHIAGADDPVLNANFNAFVDGKEIRMQEHPVDRQLQEHLKIRHGKEIALSLYERGVDIIATDAAKTSSELLRPVKR